MKFLARISGQQFYYKRLISEICGGLVVTMHKKIFVGKDLFSKCEEICRKQRICSHLLKKSQTENLAVSRVSVHFVKDC